MCLHLAVRGRSIRSSRIRWISQTFHHRSDDPCFRGNHSCRRHDNHYFCESCAYVYLHVFAYTYIMFVVCVEHFSLADYRRSEDRLPSSLCPRRGWVSHATVPSTATVSTCCLPSTGPWLSSCTLPAVLSRGFYVTACLERDTPCNNTHAHVSCNN